MSLRAGTTAPPIRHLGWMPQQHGAWAMLAVPWIVGAVRSEHGILRALPILACCLLGYLAFNAASLYLKSGRRARYRRATVTYLVGCAVAAAAATVANPAIASWAPVYLPLAGAALVFAARRKDRAVASGAITIAAACLVTVVVQYPSILAAKDFADSLMEFGYFFGTVLYVKTMLRHRGEVSYFAVSVGYHMAWAIGCLIATEINLSFFFAATTIRALAMPITGPMRGRTITPRTIGLIEIVFSATFLALLLTT